jgi:hypothetical protein
LLKKNIDALGGISYLSLEKDFGWRGTMLTRRFVLFGLIAAPAVIAADKLMAVHSLPKPYATVWGVGWDLEVVEHQVWTQRDALNFARFGIGGIDKFREITDVVYEFPIKPAKRYYSPDYAAHWYFRPETKFDRPVKINDGMTNVVTSNRLCTWQESQQLDPMARFTYPNTVREGEVQYFTMNDMGPSARVGIWDPNRAKKDDASFLAPVKKLITGT